VKTFAIILTVALSQNLFAASVTEVKNKAGETADAAVEYTKEQKDAFVLEMEENLTSLKTKIKEMKSKAGKSKDDTVVKLEKKQKNLEHDIAKMKKSSGQAWDKLKSGVSKAWSDIKSSMGEASAELTK
jgi:hypothetical protein